MTMVVPIGWQVLDANGDPYAGAKAYTYQTGTTTPQTTYSNAALSTPHANPIVADAAGRFPAVYGPTTTDYKVVLADAADVTIATYDPVQMTFTPTTGSIGTAQIDADAVTNAKLANMATQTLKGRDTGGTGDPEDLAIATVRGMLKLKPLATLVASNSASLDFTATDSTLYCGYLCTFEMILPATDGAGLLWRVSTDSGATYLSSANYHYARLASGGGTTAPGGAGSTTATSVTLASAISTGSSSYAVNGRATVNVGGAASLATQIDFSSGHGLQTTGERIRTSSTGGHSTASQVNAFQFLMSSGNIASGTIRVWGILK